MDRANSRPLGRPSRRGSPIFAPGSYALVFLLLAVLICCGGCISVDVFGENALGPLQESVVRGTEGPKILLVDIDGVISGAELTDSFFGAQEVSSVARVREVLDRARLDEEVRALLLRIDSPGGTVTASEQIYTEILRFKKERGIPVVAQFLGTAASGGYYIAMAADEVQAHPTTVTGSIGVIFSSVNVAGLMEKIGVEDQTITAGVYKDMGSPLRPLSKVERAQIQSIVDDLHSRFREIVDLGRPKLTAAEVDALANGSVYSAPQALGNGLVDRIGTLEDAVVQLEQDLGLTQTQVVAYHRPREFRRNLYTRAPTRRMSGLSGLGGIAPPMSLMGLERIMTRPGFHYLWWPGIGD